LIYSLSEPFFTPVGSKTAFWQGGAAIAPRCEKVQKGNQHTGVRVLDPMSENWLHAARDDIAALQARHCRLAAALAASLEAQGFRSRRSNMAKIYTRKCDSGQTRLFTGEQVSKDEARQSADGIRATRRVRNNSGRAFQGTKP
jgi:hypothetical protein